MTDTEEKKKSDTRRIADLHLQAQLPVLAHRIGELERVVREKFNGYLDGQFKLIYDKLNDLQCGVHVERMKNLERVILDDRSRNNVKINGLYAAFTVVVICGIILGLWMN